MLWFILEFYLDFIGFALIALGATCAAHRWLRRFQPDAGLPRVVWIAVGGIVLVGAALAAQAGVAETDRLRGRLEGLAPTYALELEMAGHARLRLDTPPDDSLCLALIEREKRWLAVNPVVNDISTPCAGTAQRRSCCWIRRPTTIATGFTREERAG